DELSTYETSLLREEERHAVVVELHIRDTGEVVCHDVYRGTILNRAKLAYKSTGAWLEGGGPMPFGIASVPGMEAQLRLQVEASEKLRGIRRARGTLSFASVEATPVMEGNEVKGLTVTTHTIAADIIESFMVAANVAMAQHLREHGSPAIRRVVQTPKRWDRIQVVAAGFGVKLLDVPNP